MRVAFVAFLVSILFSGVIATAPVAAQKPGAQLAFGVEMAKRGLWNEALFRFRQAERKDPSNPKILNNLAVAYEATGDFDAAYAEYQRALRASPNDRQLRRNYSRFIEFYQNFKPEAEAAAEGADVPDESRSAEGD